jgi:pimeloyl-ACP methyl ester carboxylesterase
MHRSVRLVASFALLYLGTCAVAGAQAPSYRFVPQPCAQGDLRGATCGSVAVPEDYARPAARTIRLNLIVFPASKPGAEKAAQFDLEGGPGFAVTDSAGFYAGDGAAYHESRDLVLADMRGTGGSNPLRCAAIEEYQNAQPAAPLYPPELVAACVKQLAAVADLRQYSTAAAARDLDAVRQALGYERIDLNALSYGTTLALRYIAEYPQRVRSAVLTGTVPAERTPPAHHAIAAELGLKLLMEACATDDACAVQYPDLGKQLDSLARRLGPEASEIYFEKLRTQLYMPATARTVPRLIHQTARGKQEPVTRGGGGRVFADGLYLAITCAESLARIDVERAIAESSATRFGAYRLRRQRDACARWPIAAVDPELFHSGSSSVPVLFLSGALDPVTPPAWAIETAKHFPHSRQVFFPEGGHVLEGLSGLDTCMDAMILKFVATLSLSDADTACARDMSRGGFAAPD